MSKKSAPWVRRVKRDNDNLECAEVKYLQHTDCKKYYFQCDKKLYVMQCENGEFFDPDLNGCAPQENVSCEIIDWSVYDDDDLSKHSSEENNGEVEDIDKIVAEYDDPDAPFSQEVY